MRDPIRVAGLCAAVVLFALTVRPLRSAPVAATQTSRTADIALARYDAGDPAALTSFISQAPSYSVVRREALAAVANSSAPVAPVFLLELAHAVYDSVREERLRMREARAILEAGCELVRRRHAGTELEQRWLLASLSLIEADSSRSLTERSAFDAHMRHVTGRLSRGVVALAKGVHHEQEVGRFLSEWGADLWRVRTADPAEFRLRLEMGRRPLRRAQTALAEAETHADVAIDAAVRLGFLAAVNQEFDRMQGGSGAADRSIRQLEFLADPTAGTPRLRYLGHLFRGRAWLSAGEPRLAGDEFRLARTAVPAQAATLALAATAFADGRLDEARALIDEATSPQAPDDPWLTYFSGSAHDWPQRIAAVRGAIGR